MPTFSKENAYLSVKLKMAFCFECGRNFPLTQDEIDALQRWSEAED